MTEKRVCNLMNFHTIVEQAEPPVCCRTRKNKLKKQLLFNRKMHQKCFKRGTKWNSRTVKYLQSNKVNQLFDGFQAFFVCFGFFSCLTNNSLTQTDGLKSV